MRSLILVIGIIVILTISGCNKVTGPEDPVPPKVETYLGYAVGDSGKIYKSLDKGASWNFQQSGVRTKLNSVCTLTDLIAIAVGNNGIIIKTTDGGNSWILQQSGTTVNLTKIKLNKLTNQLWITGEQGILLLFNVN